MSKFSRKNGVLNGNCGKRVFGTWECGKGGTFTTFSQTLLFLFEKKNSNNITTKEGKALKAQNPLGRLF